MKILFLSTWFPYPPDNGSKIRAYHLLRALRRSHQVTLVAFRPANGGTNGQPLTPEPDVSEVYPLITPIGCILATLWEIPALWVTSTTSATSL